MVSKKCTHIGKVIVFLIANENEVLSSTVAENDKAFGEYT